ncbi:tail assembly chaperone [Mycobacterium phage GodPhather]|uniref:Tail assembly chaperone n=1 Tax=Mycobacterium phage Jeon TaxID=2108123 RepID=A0A2P1JRJ7_9CAUD|nr:tail assembly chaperone [Mycobacterium phage Jeon]AVO21722.1 tail assembly chaperone [Mycobacterium phage Jeon]QBP32593.1 tail assembly chaperone [Mycobacterium phage GodPhather]WRQ08235.1 tail assembly chaperone [Mycobacterium phage harman]
MAARVRFERNEPEFDRQVTAIAARSMRRLQRRVATQARQDVPVRTGHLGRSIGEGHVRPTGLRTVSGSVHAMADYALYVHEGTGGPSRRIYPRRAKALRFNIGGRVLYRAWVRGVRARPFLRNAALRIATQETSRT